MAVDTSRSTRQGPPKFLNTLVALLLRTPLNGLIGKSIMLLTFKGRKSGKVYSIPVGYIRRGKMVQVFTDHMWWKNLRGGAPVTVRLQGKIFHGTAEAIPDDRELIAEGLMELVKQHPGAARAYGITFNADGQPNRESAREAAQRFTLVRIRLE